MGERVLIAQGREAEVFLQDDGTVLKLMREVSYAPRVDREAAALRVLAAHDLAAPTLVGTATVDGRPGLVTNRLEGVNFLTLLGRRPLSVLTAGRVLGRVHAAMHECVAPADLPDLHDDLRRRIEEAPLPAHLRSGSLEILDGLPRGDRLCHGDLHLGNIMGSYAEPVVIDWGDAARGDPLADVARTNLLHRFGVPPPGAPSLLRAVAPLGRNALVARYLATYRRHHAIDRDLLGRWQIVRAAARLSEPVPDEHPKFLRFLDRQLGRKHLLVRDYDVSNPLNRW